MVQQRVLVVMIAIHMVRSHKLSSHLQVTQQDLSETMLLCLSCSCMIHRGKTSAHRVTSLCPTVPTYVPISLSSRPSLVPSLSPLPLSFIHIGTGGREDLGQGFGGLLAQGDEMGRGRGPSVRNDYGGGQGSGQPSYQVTSAAEPSGSRFIHALTAMPSYSTKSFEELHWEDCSTGKKRLI